MRGSQQFSVEVVERLREAAAPVRASAERSFDDLEDPRLPGQWRVLDAEVDDLLAVFSHLTPRPGNRLLSYVFRDFWGSAGRPIAATAEARFPTAADVAADESVLDHVDGGRWGFMEAIRGDGTPRGFLEASIFARECEELGAFWHGLDWSDATVLGGDLADGLVGGEVRYVANEWVWVVDPPSSFDPTVVPIGDGPAAVRFFTHEPIARQTLYLNVDMYVGGKDLTSARFRAPVACGPSSFIY